jgi:hypothetical protein
VTDWKEECSPTQGREVKDTHSLTPELMLEVGIIALPPTRLAMAFSTPQASSAGIIKKRSQMLAWSRTCDTVGSFRIIDLANAGSRARSLRSSCRLSSNMCSCFLARGEDALETSLPVQGQLKHALLTPPRHHVSTTSYTACADSLISLL